MRVKFEKVSYKYEEANSECLQNVSMEIAKGELVAIVSESGGGKSTILSLMSGMIMPSEGLIFIGEDGNDVDGEEGALVLQNPEIQILGDTVREDAFLAIDSEDQKSYMLHLLKKFDLEDKLDCEATSLSFGQKRKLTLAHQLCKKPSLLLLDEPFSGLDFRSTSEIRQVIISNYKEGITQVIATHDLEPLLDMWSSIMVLSQKRLSISGCPESILPELQRFNLRAPSSWLITNQRMSWEQISNYQG